MKTLLWICFLLLLTTMSLAAPAEEIVVKKVLKDGEVVSIPFVVGEKRPQGVTDPLGKRRAAERLRKSQIDEGMFPVPEVSADFTDERYPEFFQLPSDQIIPSCDYAPGFSFPSKCYEESDNSNRKIIFEAGKDSQLVLEQIKIRYKISGEYNVVPNDYNSRFPKDESFEKLLLMAKDNPATTQKVYKDGKETLVPRKPGPNLHSKATGRTQTFVMPEDQKIPGCKYAESFSFPNLCIEGDNYNELIFDVRTDPQSKLDVLKKKYGIKGEYNRIPSGYAEELARNVEEIKKEGWYIDPQPTGTTKEPIPTASPASQ